MRRFIRMMAVMGGVVVGLCVAGWAFYLVAHGCGYLALRGPLQLWSNVPPSYGVAVANLVTLMFVVMMTGAALLTIGERKWSAMMQDRIGPNRIQVFGNPLGGIPYVLADALKSLTKENTEPAARSKVLFDLAPVLSLAPAFMLFAVVPVGQLLSGANVPLFRHDVWPGLDTSLVQMLPNGQFTFPVALQVASPDAGLLYVFGIASLAVFGTALAGWSSNSKLALLGGVRASAQMLGYEVSLGASLVGAMIAYQTLRLEQMAVAQGELLWGWLPALGVILQPVGLVVFFASAFAETKRAPFDLPEGESEIVGYFVEYSGMKFGMMMLAEFIEVLVLGAIVTAIFLGGWHPIFFEGWLRDHLPPIWFAAVGAGSFMMKTLLLCWFQLTVRWTLPRFRYDQIQRLCWKMLLPVALGNVFLTGFVVLLDPSLHLLGILGLVEIVAIISLAAVATSAAVVEPAHEPGHAAAAHH